LKTIKNNSSTNIIKLNNQTYIPFQLHQLPKYYNEISLSEQFNLKGYTYININSLKSYNIDTHSLNKDLNYKLKR
jgi:hypothetical protein